MTKICKLRLNSHFVLDASTQLKRVKQENNYMKKYAILIFMHKHVLHDIAYLQYQHEVAIHQINVCDDFVGTACTTEVSNHYAQ
jgi:hypothetical protein